LVYWFITQIKAIIRRAEELAIATLSPFIAPSSSSSSASS